MTVLAIPIVLLIEEGNKGSAHGMERKIVSHRGGFRDNE